MYNSAWYNNLIKPAFAPNNELFAPVWTILYLLIFISLILYILTKKEEKGAGYTYFTIQMILNLIWSPIFFFFQQITLALVVIILLDIFVILTIKKFYSISKLSAVLLIPYLIWILFATYLNFAYMILN
ncbi:tryptophan-rich sensory protein [bacterium]|nr:tryptophan-rich sensory protein [bacterium]